MPGLQPTTASLEPPGREFAFDEAHVAAVAFLARYGGRTLDACRFDLRSFFQWTTDAKLPVLDATRPHLELYRTTLEERGIAASTIDRRLSTVCGFYRFAHIDGRISSNPAQYVRRPKVYPSEGRGMDRGELGTFLFTAERFDRDHAALAVLLGLNGLRVARRAERTSRTSALTADTEPFASSGRATSRPSSRSCRARRERLTSPSGNGRRDRSCAGATASDSTAEPPTVGCAQSASGQAWEPSTPTCSGPGSSWPPSTPVFRCATFRSPPDTPIQGRRRSTTVVGRASTDTPPTSPSPSLLAANRRRATRASPRGTLMTRGTSL